MKLVYKDWEKWLFFPQSVEENEETGKHSPNKGTTTTNLQKLTLKK